jgi:hypothetical protein
MIQELMIELENMNMTTGIRLTAMATLLLMPLAAVLGDTLPDFLHAAEHHLTHVWHSERHQLVRVHLAPGDRIAEHISGPRIIVPLDDMSLKRTDSGKRMVMRGGSGRWLTNRHSEGMENVGSKSGDYLALLFPPSNYPKVDDDSQGNCSVQGGSSTLLTHRPYASACTATASGDQIMRVAKWRLVYFQTDAIMCVGDDCHHCKAGAAWYLSKGAAIRPTDGGRASIVLFRF